MRPAAAKPDPPASAARANTARTSYGTRLALPDTGSVVTDAREHLRCLVTFLVDAPGGRVMRALIGLAQHDAGVAEVLRVRYLDDRRATDRTILERGVERGELGDDIDLELVLDQLYGPIYHRLLLTEQPIDAAFVDALVDGVLVPLIKPRRRRRRAA